MTQTELEKEIIQIEFDNRGEFKTRVELLVQLFNRYKKEPTGAKDKYD